MSDPSPERRTVDASDGYPIHLTTWRPVEKPRGVVVVLHGVQSHAGWYDRLGRNLSDSGCVVHFPDRRGSGSNTVDRGHARSARRLYQDVAEHVELARSLNPGLPVVLGGISWGGKLAVMTAARRPELVDGIALMCPGLQPQVGVGAKEGLRIFLAWAASGLAARRRYFPIPLADPALFTGSPEWQDFIARDPLSLRQASASLLAASRIIDFGVRRAPSRIIRPVLLMLAGHDRIVDNDRTRAYFDRMDRSLLTVVDYPDAHHTLEFEPDPDTYARDLLAWMDGLPARPR